MFEVMSMPKIRVSELAKEINIDVKELLEYLAGLDANTKNHMSFVDEALAVQARRRFSKTGALDIQVKPVQPRPVGMPPRARGPIRRGRPIGAASKPGDLGQAPAPGEKAEGKPGGAAVPQAPAITPAASAAATAQAAKTPSAECGGSCVSGHGNTGGNDYTSGSGQNRRAGCSHCTGCSCQTGPCRQAGSLRQTGSCCQSGGSRKSGDSRQTSGSSGSPGHGSFGGSSGHRRAVCPTSG